MFVLNVMMKKKIFIKALSSNSGWQGRRFKNKRYKDYEQQLLLLLPNIKIPEGNISLSIDFGLSSANSDLDNLVKFFIDCCQKKYNFNDRKIMKLTLEKFKVKKGEEFIEFNFN